MSKYVVILLDEDMGTKTYGPLEYEDAVRLGCKLRGETGKQVNVNELFQPE